MVRYLPIGLGIVAIIGFWVAEAIVSGRYQSSNISAEQFAELLKDIPLDIGDWHGQDLEVTEQVRKTAGARGYVSRTYHNSATGEDVTIWLIVGHSRDVMRHTPNICYPSQGFKPRAPEDSRHTFTFEKQDPAEFYTNTFVKEGIGGRHLERVFWAWYKPEDDGKVAWKAPKKVKFEFGNTPSLYKLYFSNTMRDNRETTEDSPCTKFAEIFLPIVENALSTTAVAGEGTVGEGESELEFDLEPTAETES
jgi:hypothetical protein